MEALHEIGKSQIAVKRIGLPDSYVEHGTIPKLQELCGMDASAVVNAVTEGLKKSLIPSSIA